MWNLKTGDYHKEINNDSYIRRLKEKLLPNLPQNCVFVVDNATYHNVLGERYPTSSLKKGDM
jgi:hypothetical protein